MRDLLAVGVLAAFLSASSASANGLCPFDEQGPLGCPEGTVWYAQIEVCLPPQTVVG